MPSAEGRAKLVRRGFEAYGEGRLEGVFELLDSEVEIRTSPGLINAGTHRGHDGFLGDADG